MNNQELIIHFYKSFRQGNAEAMSECYDEQIVFTDPAFGTLSGTAVKMMWQMLIERSKGNLNIHFDHVIADDYRGSAVWIADYVFTQTGRRVNNRIVAYFEFANGKITKHTDHFNLWRWSSQALGFKGFLFGWTPFMRNQIQRKTRQLLSKYQKDHQ